MEEFSSLNIFDKSRFTLTTCDIKSFHDLPCAFISLLGFSSGLDKQQCPACTKPCPKGRDKFFTKEGNLTHIAAILTKRADNLTPATGNLTKRASRGSKRISLLIKRTDNCTIGTGNLTLEVAILTKRDDLSLQVS